MNDSLILRLAVGLVAMVLSGAVHEFAHAFAAWRLGDDTAARQGRLTLNPLAHIDVMGTLVLPALMLVSGGGILGWAKPVPYQPSNLTRRYRLKTSELLIAGAGPMANVVMAFLSAGVISVLMNTQVLDHDSAEPFLVLAYFMVQLNVVLALFNLIPLPPLDGAKVVMGLLPDGPGRAFQAALDRIREYAFFILIAVVVVGGRYLFMAESAIVSLIFQLVGVPI